MVEVKSLHNPIRSNLFIVLQREGIAIIDDIPACENLFRQAFANQKREVNLLIAALRERIPQNIILYKDLKPNDALLHQWAKQLVTQRGITEDASFWAVESWAIAMGKVIYPSSFLEALWDVDFLESTVIELGLNTFIEYMRLIAQNLFVQQKIGQLSSLVVFHKNRLDILERSLTQLKGWDPGQEPAYFLQVLRNFCEGPALATMVSALEASLRVRNLPYFRLLGSTLAHHDHVVSIATNNTGKLICTASWDKCVKIFEFPTLQETGFVIRHKSQVRKLSVHPESIAGISGTADGELSFWNLAEKKVLWSVLAHKAPINGLEISPDGHWLVSCAQDGEIQVWDLERKQKAYSIQSEAGVNTAIAITPDSQKFITIFSKDSIKVWALETARLINTFNQEKQAVKLVINPADKHLITAYIDGSVSIWEISQGIKLTTWQAHSTKIVEMAIDTGGMVLGSVDTEGSLKTWNAQKGEFIARLDMLAPIKSIFPIPHTSGWVIGNAGGAVSNYELIGLPIVFS